MDKNYIKYTLDKIESAVNDYTTMDREDVEEYVLMCVKCLMKEYKKTTRESD